MAALFTSVTNSFARNALIKTLTAVVAATTDITKLATVPASNYATLKTEQAEKLVAADPSFVQVVPGPDDKHKFVMATAAGIAAVQSSDPLPAPVARTPVVAGSFTIETGIAVPSIKRGGDRAFAYPFDKLEIGQSFFVPATEAMPEPGKTLASTVSTATRRYAKATPPKVFTIRKNEDQFPGAADTGVKGARIWRIEPKDATPEQADGSDPTGAPANVPAASPFV